MPVGFLLILCRYLQGSLSISSTKHCEISRYPHSYDHFKLRPIFTIVYSHNPHIIHSTLVTPTHTTNQFRMVQILGQNIQPLSCQIIYLNFAAIQFSMWKPNISSFWFGTPLPENLTFWGVVSNLFISLMLLYVFFSPPIQQSTHTSRTQT